MWEGEEGLFDPREGRTEAPDVPGRQAPDEGKLVAQLRDEDGDRLSTRRRPPSEGRRRPDAHEPNRVLKGRGEVGHSLGCRGANLAQGICAEAALERIAARKIPPPICGGSP